MLPNKAAYKGVGVAHSSLSSGTNYQPINHESDPTDPQLRGRAWAVLRWSGETSPVICYNH